MANAGCDAASIAGDYSLVELADVLAASDVVVSVNTGVMHLAALLGVAHRQPRGTSPRSTLGAGRPARTIRRVDAAGCGYLDLGFEYAGQRLDCMDGVAVDAVVTASAI